MPSMRMLLTAGFTAGTLAVAGPTAVLAHGVTVIVTREANKPERVEIGVGEEVHWTNNTGGVAHIAFRGDDAIQFQVGSQAAHVRFHQPGTYEYTVHVSGVKSHAHTGSVTVRPR